MSLIVILGIAVAYVVFSWFCGSFLAAGTPPDPIDLPQPADPPTKRVFPSCCQECGIRFLPNDHVRLQVRSGRPRILCVGCYSEITALIREAARAN